MMRKILVLWRDIPSQVIVQRGRRREKALLSPRFQEAIDRAAMRAGKGGSAAYLADWRREAEALDGGGDPRRIARAEAKRLESEFTQERLDALIRSHGAAPESTANPKAGHGAAPQSAANPNAGPGAAAERPRTR